MPDKFSRLRVKTDSLSPPQIDGQPVQNEILLSLPAKERDQVFPLLTFVELRTHDVLHEPGDVIKFGYFLNHGMVSILTVLAEGKSVEVGLTGKEGFVGLPLIVGFSSGPTQAVVQIAGNAFRINARSLIQVVRQCPVLSNQLQRYVQMLAMQGTQVAACNRLHEVDETTGALAPDVPGPNQFQPGAFDPGISRPHAGYSPCQRYSGSRDTAKGWTHYLPARTR